MLNDKSNDEIISNLGNITNNPAHDQIQLPSAEWLFDANFTREGSDLLLALPDGREILIEDYFIHTPTLSHYGQSLTPELVDSFLIDGRVAQNASFQSEPIAKISFLQGEAVVVRIDGSREPLDVNTQLYQGDIVETMDGGSLKMTFIDDTVMSLSNNARMALDKMVFDAGDGSGETALSILKGNFLFISGKIAKTDPDDMVVNTPVATIGIRGTVVSGEIGIDGSYSVSVVDGAIAMVREGQEPIVMNDNFAMIEGNILIDGGLSETVRVADAREVIARNSGSFATLSDNEIASVEAAVKQSVEQATGEAPELDLGAKIKEAVDAANNDENEDDNNDDEANASQAEDVIADAEIADEESAEDADFEALLANATETEEEVEEEVDNDRKTDNDSNVNETTIFINLADLQGSTTEPELDDGYAGWGGADALYYDLREDYAGKDLDITDTENNEAILTGDGNDRISSRGTDFIHAGSGNDTITSSGEGAVIYGGAGNDTITSSRAAAIFGGDGNDIITSSGDAGLIMGGDGNDRIIINNTFVSLLAGDGDDVVIMNNVASVNPNSSDNMGGDGTDSLFLNYGGDNYVKGDKLGDMDAATAFTIADFGTDFENITITGNKHQDFDQFDTPLVSLSNGISDENLNLTLRSSWDGPAHNGWEHSSANHLFAVSADMTVGNLTMDLRDAHFLDNVALMLSATGDVSASTLTIQLDGDFTYNQIDSASQTFMKATSFGFDNINIVGNDNFVANIIVNSDDDSTFYLSHKDSAFMGTASDDNASFDVSKLKIFDGNDGTDTLTLTSSETTPEALLLSGEGSPIIRNLDILDLTNYTGTPVTFTNEILKAITDNQDHVNGGTGQTLVVKGGVGKIDTGSVTADAGTDLNGYQIYNFGETILYVDTSTT